MDEKALKTSLGQRIAIIAIAILLLGGTLLTYIFVVLNNGSSSSTSKQEELIEQLGNEYDAKSAELDVVVAELSEKYFDDFVGYLSQVKAYNSANANAAGLEIKDLKVGTGSTLTDGDTNYMPYYIGWCADGSIFDSSFNDAEDPTSLKAPLAPFTSSFIEGWEQGIVGMKLGGVRQLTIAGELAYGDTQEICGTTNAPLKFIIYALEPDTEWVELSQDIDDIRMELIYVLYGGAF